MKTDHQLQRDVMDELEWVPDVDAAQIGITAKGGVVTISGSVENYAQKMAAEHAVAGVLGVQALAQELKVRFASDPKTSDAEIAGRILDVLSWNVTVPHEKIAVKVENNWVTISGTVEWNYQKQAAHAAAGHIGGVLGVTDLITVRNTPSTADIRERILAAFKRSSAADATGIRVTAESGTVTLGGNVHGSHERMLAERAAWGAPGVFYVEDNIVVN